MKRYKLFFLKHGTFFLVSEVCLLLNELTKNI